MAWKGMADIFDDSMNAVDPVAIVRMFASKQYCTCSQVHRLFVFPCPVVCNSCRKLMAVGPLLLLTTFVFFTILCPPVLVHQNFPANSIIAVEKSF
jgi:hypothetical protein